MTEPSRTFEIERKYDVDSGTPLPDWSAVPGVTHVSAGEQRGLDARYFDTADLALSRAGVALRRRTGGPDAGWHIKGPREGDGRLELGWPLDDDGGAPQRAGVRRIDSTDAPAAEGTTPPGSGAEATVPPELAGEGTTAPGSAAEAAVSPEPATDAVSRQRSAAHAVARLTSAAEVAAPLGPATAAIALPEPVAAAVARWTIEPLTPLARIENARTAYHLSGPHGVIAEFVDDHVSATDLRTDERRTWREWEMELGPAAPDDVHDRDAFFAAVEAAVFAAGGRPAASGSKLARALGF